MGTLDDTARTRIRQWMRDHGATQADLAAVTGWTQPTVSKYLLRRIDAGLDELHAMASFFGHSLSDLVSDTPPVQTEASRFVGQFNALSRAARQALLRMMATFPRQARVTWRLPSTPVPPPADRRSSDGRRATDSPRP